MAKYFFHLRGGSADVSDLTGTQCDDLEAVRLRAYRAAREIIAHEVLGGRLPLGERIEVEDEDQRPVFTLPFRAAVEEV